MLITVVMIVSTSILTSAQPTSDSACNETYNGIFGDATRNTTTCGAAYSALRNGNATEEQSMMVCSASHECNSMIQNITNLCSNNQMSTNELPTLDLCTNGSNGVVNDCLFAFSAAMANDTINVASMAVTTSCGTTCNQTCRQNLMILVSAFGCCLAEGLQTQISNANESIENSIANSIANAIETCEIPLQSCNNGSTLPSQNMSSSCTNATTNLFDPNDECSRAVRELFKDGNNDSSMISVIFNGDCPTRLHDYATFCRMNDDRILQVASTVLSISQATDSNGRRCSEFVLAVLQEYDNGITCTSDFLKNQCPDTCKQTLMNWIRLYGCCFNTIIGESIGRSNIIHEQIDYAILTRDIYDLCGISSGGFCAGINKPSYTAAAEQCITARNAFFGDSICLEYYLTLDQRTTAIVVNRVATAICASQRCKNRISVYIDFLINCQERSLQLVDENKQFFILQILSNVAATTLYTDATEKLVNAIKNTLQEDDNNNDEVAYIGYLIGNTTCRVDSANNTCYSSIFFNQQYAMVAAAFDTNNTNAECASMMTTEEEACPSTCMQLLTEAMDSVGCCLGEYSRVLLGDEFIDTISTTCNVTLNVRCTEIQAIYDIDDNDDDDVDAGANTLKGLGLLTILLIGMITMYMWLL